MGQPDLGVARDAVIAARLGCRNAQVKAAREAKGLARGTGPYRSKLWKLSQDPEAATASVETLAKRYDCTVPSVRRAKKALGIAPPPRKGGAGKKRPNTISGKLRADPDLMLLPIRELAARYGCTYQLVSLVRAAELLREGAET